MLPLTLIRLAPCTQLQPAPVPAGCQPAAVAPHYCQPGPADGQGGVRCMLPYLLTAWDCCGESAFKFLIAGAGGKVSAGCAA